MSIKYRPTLTSEEISDIIAALEIHNPISSALGTLKIFAYKQSLGMVKPASQRASTSAKIVETPEQKAEREAREIKEIADSFAKMAVPDASKL